MNITQSKYNALLGFHKKVSFSNRISNLFQRFSFYRELKSGSFGINSKQYILLSLVMGLGLPFFYLNVLPNFWVLLTIGLNGIIIPFVYFKQKLLKIRIDDSMHFKGFLDTLTSEFIIGSTTTQALENVLKMKRLSHSIRSSIENMLYDIKLGSGVIETLDKARNSLFIDKDLRIVLSILIINHSSGSKATISGLNSIGVQMKDRMENIVDLKKSMAGINGQRYIFFVLVLLLPLILGVQRSSFFDFTLKSTVGILLLCGAFLVTFIGQIIIDGFITNVTNKF